MVIVTLRGQELGPFRLFTDPVLQSEVSKLSLENPLTLDRLVRPGALRSSLFPNGDFGESDLSVLDPASTVTTTHNDEWSTSGPYSCRLDPTSSTTGVIVASSSDLVLPAEDRSFYSVGMDVRNSSPVPRRARLEVTIGADEFLSDTEDFEPFEDRRLNVVGARSVAPPTTPAASPFGTAYYSRISWELTTPDLLDPQDYFYLDSIQVGRGLDPTFVRHQQYPDRESNRGRPFQLWVYNASAETYENIRAILLPSGPDHSRPTLEVSRNPDIIPWIEADISAVTFYADSMAPGANVDFWIRPIIDDTFEFGNHFLNLFLMGDKV